MNLDNPIFEDWIINQHTTKLVNILKNKSNDILQKELKISDKILEDVMNYINNFDKKTCYKAIEMYNGIVFKELNVNTMNKKDTLYLENNLLILSAFYGILKPFDLVKPYRLDFNSKLKIDRVSLKKYWKEFYNSYINVGEDIINLASNEFADLFNKSNYNWYDFDFFEFDGENKKINSTIAKKGRGKLLRELAENNICDVKDIYKLNSYKKYFEFV